MMKITLTIFVAILIACGQAANDQDHEKDLSYKVYKIDSINSYYLIYASKNDSLFKIVSKKEVASDCDPIQKDSQYPFRLHSSLADRSIGGKNILPQNSLLVNCFTYDDSTSICLEGDSIRDLYYADNIRGLCFLKSK